MIRFEKLTAPFRYKKIEIFFVIFVQIFLLTSFLSAVHCFFALSDRLIRGAGFLEMVRFPLLTVRPVPIYFNAVDMAARLTYLVILVLAFILSLNSGKFFEQSYSRIRFPNGIKYWRQKELHKELP